jgi:DNA-3-methyladenine glycosylase
LLRAIEPTEGIDLMKERRGMEDIRKLCNGPAKLCQALGITMKLNGLNMFDPDAPIQITLPKKSVESEAIVVSKRIGITKNAEALLRFSIKDSEFVSRQQKAPAKGSLLL